MDRTDLDRRLQEYAVRRGLAIKNPLGSGVHGSVFSAESQADAARVAVKVHVQNEAYARERDVYLRLRKHGITQVRGCNVPQLLSHDDDLWILEMTIVARPYVLDFGGAFLDQAPTFPDDVMADWLREKQEQFGSHWREAQVILAYLEGQGIHVIDVNPRNICLE